MTQLISKITIALVSAAAFLVVSAKASIVVVEDPSLQSSVSSITHTVEGDDMVGMLVTAVFFDGSFETTPWFATGIDSGMVSGTAGGGWSLSLAGDTYFDDWILTNDQGSNMKSLFIDAWSGNLAFDLTFGGAVGTPTSDLGFSFGDALSVSPATYYLPAVADATGTYSRAIGLSPNSPVGDLYGGLRIEFGGLPALGLDEGFPSGGGPGGLFPEFRFRADTDLVQPVPEPSTVAMGLAAGMFGLVGYGLKRVRRRGARS